MSDRSDGSRPRFVRPVTPAELWDGLKALMGEAANNCFGLVGRCVEERGGVVHDI